MTTFEVTLMKKGTFDGKKVMVLANNKTDACHKAIRIQPNAGTWVALTAKVEADRMETKFKHPGVRYSWRKRLQSYFSCYNVFFTLLLKGYKMDPILYEHNEIVIMLADTFSAMPGEDVARIFNSIMAEQIEYVGDDTFQQISVDV